MKRLLLFLCLVSAAIYMLALPRAVPEGEEEIAIAQGGDDSKQRPHGPLHSSWGSTLQSLRQKPDASAPSQETARFRQAGAYRKGPDPGQADPEQIIGTNDLTGSVDEASAAATGSSDGEATRWAKITLAARLHSEASVSSPIVGYYSPGKEVQIRGYVNGWFRVLDPKTQEGGWVFYKYLAYIHAPTPAQAQIAATAQPTAKIASPTSRKPTRTAKRATRKVAKRHERRGRFAERRERWLGFGLFRRHEARRAWSIGPAR